ncbi:MAG TPA: 50S ribosomal protein L24e [Methanomicrobiales archaeon]|nr:50S ribosomal protein L24e [Methanomicrobiales archaeon]
MVDIRNCSFCGENIEPGTGKMFVRRDGTIFYFCSSKCQNNANLGRVPRRVRWTQAGRKALGKE